ncbi:hypothetical protein [Bradyrhizobium sp. WD16]|uniref:hypothetical protein n=1 Tax=Bradyrhizobium sp. WD16 TaxID=1521768 RepID=UPI0020A3669C|nr:hypothetical protein [Bradyrhizobium sp. WD16]
MRIVSAASSPIMIISAFVLPPTSVDITEASAMPQILDALKIDLQSITRRNV